MHTNIDTQAYRPTVFFLNGVYWGIINIREKLNEDYLAAHHNIDPDNVDMLESIYYRERGFDEVIESDAEHYTAMYDFIESHDLSDSANYRYVTTQMDVNNYID